MRAHRVACATCLATAAWANAAAQELEPRAYANAPVGLNFLIASYAYSEGGVVPDPAIPVENAQLTLHTGVVAYARSFAAWGRSAKFDLTAPYSALDGAATIGGVPGERAVSGWADPRFRVSLNLFGAPAVSLAQIDSYRQDLIVGVSLLLWAPAGQYDKSKAVNIGANRWHVKPEIGVSKAVGQWIFELTAAVSFYQDNDEYLRERTREQEPIYSGQGAAIYSFPRGIWIAAAATYYTGGRTRLDGVSGDDLQENSRFGLIVTMPVNRHNSIKLYANTGVSTRTGNDFDSAGVAWQHRWGGGL